MRFPMANKTGKHSGLLLLFLLCAVLLYGQASMYDDDIVSVPAQPRLVNDFAQMLSMPEAADLEQKLVQYQEETSTEIAVVTVPTLGPYPVEEYGIRLARKWGIGSKKDNGILILIAQKERKFDIETGYGIGQYISDIDANRILREILTPDFKDGNYYRGLDRATDRMIQLLEGGFESEKKKQDINWMMVGLIIALFVFIIYVSYKNDGNDHTTYSGTGRRTYQPPIYGGGYGRGFGSGGGFGGSGGGFGSFGGGGFGGGGASGGW